MLRQDEATHYYTPGVGWGEETPDSTMRITAQFAIEPRVVSVNDLAVRRPDGSWVPADTDATPVESVGLHWAGWDSTRKGYPLVLLEGVCALTPALARELLEGCSPYDWNGDPLESIEAAGVRFALTPDDATRFAGRVAQRGGSIRKRAPSLGKAPVLAQRLAQATQELAQRRSRASGLLTSLSSGAMADVPDLLDISGAAAAQAREVDELWGEMTTTIADAERAGLGAAELAGMGEILAQHSDSHTQALSDAAFLGAARRQALAALAGVDDLDARGHQAPHITDLLADLAAWLCARGTTAQLDRGELVIHTPAGDEIRIGEDASVRSATP